jgi:lipopolysaccharide/colanic/teichoic acid biosynthesis glycosyltransferase
MTSMRRLARVLLYAGIVVTVLALAKVHARYIGHYDLTSRVPSRFGWTVGYVVIQAIAAYGAGLPELPRSTRAALVTAVGACGAGAALVSVAQLVVGDALLPRFVVLGSAVVLPVWYLVCAAVARSGRSRAESHDRVALVGERTEAEALAVDLDHEPERPAVLVARLSIDEAQSHGHRSRPLVERVVDEAATVVVLDRLAQADPSIVSQAAALHEAGIRVRTLLQFYEEWLGKLPLPELERASLFFDISEVHGSRYLRAKRLGDVVVAAAGLALMAVAIPFVAVANSAANRGSLFYRQPRVGKNGRLFTMLKFRTMRPSADATGEWTAKADPRITRFGRVLRLTHLDELPQVVNVLRGDLSIVGPRPEQPQYVEELLEKLPFYGLRHLVRPGLTGWAQVKYGYADSETDALEKLQFEFYYLRHQSLGLDVRIVGRTIRSVLGLEGR